MMDGLEDYFRENFSQRGEVGASVSVWKDGEEIIGLVEGWCEREKLRKWNAGTLVPVYSATKVSAAATLLHVLSRKGLDEETSVYKEGFYAAFNTPESITRRAFSSPRGLHAVAEMNEPKAWAAALSAMGGVASARGLAKFYQLAIGAIDGPFSESVRRALAGLRISGEDKVLLRETAFTCGGQKDPVDAAGKKKRKVYGESAAAFGHPGAGGSHGFGDPAGGVSFAYVMNQMELSVMPGERCAGLVQRLG